jgi:hypothetical protein
VTERDIQGAVLALVGAIKADDEKTMLQAGTMLITQVFVDLNRIAGALEHIASEINK